MTPRLSLIELERRCQKPESRRIGNFMARRISRPMALRVTWLIAPWGISAHTITLLAWCVSLASAVAFAGGTPLAWCLGAILLQVWYLLDHVDGQIARLRGTASLDGVQFDYLMHHWVQAVIPTGLGWGLCFQHGEPIWMLAGLAWAAGTLMLGLLHDARYKAFVQRLKRVQGELLVVGGGGARPTPNSGWPQGWLRRCVWLARKSSEPHVTMNLLTLLAATAWAADTWWLRGSGAFLIQAYLSVMATVCPVLFAATLWRSLHRGTAELEFKAWYVPPPGSTLTFRDGWWLIEPGSEPEGETSRAAPR